MLPARSLPLPSPPPASGSARNLEALPDEPENDPNAFEDKTATFEDKTAEACTIARRPLDANAQSGTRPRVVEDMASGLRPRPASHVDPTLLSGAWPPGVVPPPSSPAPIAHLAAANLPVPNGTVVTPAPMLAPALIPPPAATFVAPVVPLAPPAPSIVGPMPYVAPDASSRVLLTVARVALSILGTLLIAATVFVVLERRTQPAAPTSTVTMPEIPSAPVAPVVDPGSAVAPAPSLAPTNHEPKKKASKPAAAPARHAPAGAPGVREL